MNINFGVAYLFLCYVQAYIEKEDNKKLKQKQRERMQPKMGKMDIDYQVCGILWCLLCISMLFACD